MAEIEYIEINPVTRKIVTPSDMLLGVMEDKDVERRYFRCPKIVGDNVDLAKHQIYIKYAKSAGVREFEGDTQYYHCDDVRDEGDFITFSWKLSGNVFLKEGFMAFSILASDGDVTRWNTYPAIGTVLMTIPGGIEEVVERYPDIISQLLNRMDAVEAMATPEAMQGYVNEYLGKHPVQLDETLTDNTKAAPAGIVGDLKSDIVNLDNLLKKTLVQDYNMKIAIDNLFKCVAYDGESDYVSAYENFKIACGISDVLYISAVINGEYAAIGTDAKDLDITITGHYADGKTAKLTGWTISGMVVAGTNVFTVVLGEFTTTVSVTGVEELIPSEYTRCIYIKSSGTQYIEVPTKKMIAGTDKFTVDFEINEDCVDDRMLFGGYTENATGRLGLNWNYGYINYSGANAWVVKQSGFELLTGVRTSAILDTKNGIAQLGKNTSEFATKSYTSNNICIFGYKNSNRSVTHKISMTLYRFKQYRNDKLYTDLVPCLRNSDNVIGLYDLVDGVFYTNGGTGTFEYEVI